MKSPIKRTEALKPISREHHHGLLLCWKIRQGLRQQVSVDRIKSYLDWFSKEYLDPHFFIEERYLFPVLGNEHVLVKRALAEHRRLKRLFNQRTEISKALWLIEEELDLHIRFEERVLFNEIQKIDTPDQLENLKKQHHPLSISDDQWNDPFWESNA